VNRAKTIRTSSTDETRALAEELGGTLSDRAVVALYGDLGAGKTCFVQGLAEALGVREPVTSPTFSLVNEYRGVTPFFHVDLYRIASPEEAIDFGLEETMDGRGITAIEWAERAEGILPRRTIRVKISQGDTEDERRVRIDPGSPL